MHRVKELYRGDPVTMFIYSDELGRRGTKGFTCVNHRGIIHSEPHEQCEVCGSNLFPVHYVNRATGEEQYFLKEKLSVLVLFICAESSFGNVIVYI